MDVWPAQPNHVFPPVSCHQGAPSPLRCHSVTATQRELFLAPEGAAGCVWDGHCSLTPTLQGSHCKQPQPVHLSQINEQGPHNTNQIGGRPILVHWGVAAALMEIPSLPEGKGSDRKHRGHPFVPVHPSFPSLPTWWWMGVRKTKANSSRGGPSHCPHRAPQPHREASGQTDPRKGQTATQMLPADINLPIN